MKLPYFVEVRWQFRCNRKIAVQNDLWKFCYKLYENSCKHKNLSILSVFRGNRCRKNCSRIASQVVNFMRVLTANLERCRLTRKHVTRMKHREREREREREGRVWRRRTRCEKFSLFAEIDTILSNWSMQTRRKRKAHGSVVDLRVKDGALW